LEKPENSGFFNVNAYLESALVWLSGRVVEIEIDNTSLKIEADKSDEVYGLYFTHNNSCKIPEGVEKTICKIGETNCCIFISGGSDGFSCQKFNDLTARVLLDRLAKKEIRANRIGNCTLLGRKDGAKELSVQN
jgi:hypothetical protein